MPEVTILGLDNVCGLIKDIGNLFWIVHPVPGEIIGSSAGEAGSNPLDDADQMYCWYNDENGPLPVVFLPKT